MSKGFSSVLLIILVIGLITGVYLVKKTTNVLPKAYEAKDSYIITSDVRDYASDYINSANKNIVDLAYGKKCIVPSQAYADSIYVRDAFYSVIGLDDVSLSKDCFGQFDQTLAENGQVRFAVPVNPSGASFGFKDDEANMLYLIWAGILNRSGVLIDQQTIKKAYAFITTHVENGWFISPAGDFRYWADTYLNQNGDTITYNQGFYALSLRFLREIDSDLASDETVSKAENNYASLFKDGYLPLSKNTEYQDASALLPEFLTRFYFNQGMLSDTQVLTGVDRCG